MNFNDIKVEVSNTNEYHKCQMDAEQTLLIICGSVTEMIYTAVCRKKFSCMNTI